MPMSQRYSVFLSYSHADTRIMERIKKSLVDAGIEVWTDEKLTVGTPEWEREIEKAIENSDCFVVLLSPNAKDSKWVRIEISYAMTLDRQIYPILANGDEKTAIPIVLINYQFVDIRTGTNYEDRLEKLVEQIVNQSKRHTSNKAKFNEQIKYRLWLDSRWEQLQSDLQEAEINNDVSAFIRAQNAYEKDLKLQQLDLQIASLDVTLEEEYSIRRQKILVNLKHELYLAEMNNDSRSFLEARHSAETNMREMEKEYLIRGGLNEQTIKDELYNEVLQLVSTSEKISYADLIFILINPKYIEEFFDRLIKDNKIDPNTKQLDFQGGWEYQVINDLDE